LDEEKLKRDAMREIAISEFKARCLALLEEVSKTRKPIRITRRGKPIAEVVPLHVHAARPRRSAALAAGGGASGAG